MATTKGNGVAGHPVLKYDELLSPTTFRLAELLESSDPNRICFDLTTHELSEAPSFVALSYVCGKAYTSFDVRQHVDEPPVRDCTVYVNGFPVLIYENLRLFLLTLMDQKLWGTVWIDAICINQNDAKEKTLQILLMESIYASAHHVLGWLGPYNSEHEADDFDWALKTFMPAVAHAIDVHGSEALDSLQITDPALPSLLAVEGPIARLAGCLRYESTCRYFKRAWTYQEVVQASAVVLMCGNRKYSALDLCNFAIDMKTRGWEVVAQLDPLPTMRISHAEALSGIIRWRSMIRDESAREKHFDKISQALVSASMKASLSSSDPSPAWLTVVLHWTNGTSCTDPRDRLYSLLGLAKRFPISPLNAYIPVDYTYSWQQLYTITATAVLRRSGCLIPLHTVESRPFSSIDNKLPSWVPNYRAINSTMPHIFLWTFRVGEELDFDASCSMKNAIPTFEILEDTLVATGAEVDEIKYASPSSMEAFMKPMGDTTDIIRFLSLWKPSEGRFDSHRAWKTFTLAECQNFSKGQPEDEDDIRAASFRNYMIAKCAESLVVNMIDVEHADLERILQDLDQLYKKVASGVLGTSGWSLEEVMDLYEMFELLDSSDETQVNTTQQQMHKIDEGSEFFRRAFAPVAEGRRLYITQKDHLVLGPLCGEIGDRVFILQDSRSLQMLRPTGNEHEYRYVGEAYIDGCMNGQLLQGSDSLADKYHKVRIV